MFNGWCLSRGLAPKNLEVADFQDLVLNWLMEHRDENGLYELERDLTLPPLDYEVAANDPIWGDEAEMGLFMALIPKD